MPQQRIITLASVAKHRSSDSNWFVIHDSVYDVTEFLSEHPGGEEVMLEQGGGNATEAFENAGHSGDVRKFMEQFKIGILSDEECQEKETRAKQREHEAKARQQLIDKENAQKKALKGRIFGFPIWLIVLIAAIAPVVLYKLFGYVE